jgi:hypothetical protein
MDYFSWLDKEEGKSKNPQGCWAKTASTILKSGQLFNNVVNKEVKYQLSAAIRHKQYLEK